MGISWQYVYQAGQWFWVEPVIVHILSLVEGLLFLWFIRHLGHRRRDPFWIGAECLCFLGIEVYVQLCALPVVKHCISILCLYFFYILLLRRSSWKNAVFLSSIFCLIVELGKLVIKDGPIAGLMASVLSTNGEGVLFNSLLLVLYLIFIAMLTVCIHKSILHHKRDDIPLAQMISLVLPLILYLYVRNLQFYYMGSDEYLWTQLQIVEIFAAGSALAVLITTEHYLSILLERNELLNLDLLQRQQQQQFLVRKETIDAVNRRYHDLKHYLTALEALSPEETKEYIQGIRREITPYECSQDTGNEILDILLTDHMRTCQEKDIRMVPYIDGRQLDFIHSMDLCALFGNAMDNAIEAVSTVQDPELREINVKIGISGQMVIMHFQNYFDGVLKMDGHRLLTRKSERESHGYGLENIRRVAEKYNGTAAYEAQGQVFSLNIILPLPEQSVC